MHRSRAEAFSRGRKGYAAGRGRPGSYQAEPEKPPRRQLQETNDYADRFDRDLDGRNNAQQAASSGLGEQNYVWIRVDVVDAIWNNNGSLPRGWKPSPSSRKRGRDETHSWDWMRAFTVHSSASNRSTSPTKFRSKHNAQTILATFTVDDIDFAPLHLQNATVSLSYDPSEPVDPLVCSANTWWQRTHPTKEPKPPDDLTVLPHLHEPSVVFCLQHRYQEDVIYTYTGKILLALNPFRVLDGVYGDSIMENYWQPNPLERPPPHVYAIAQDAYKSMLQGMETVDRRKPTSSDQSILVSGESGSGKTVTTKIIMDYLAKQSQRTMARTGGEAEKEGIESQILQSNPILESFGNARTVRNDNSSRFGKFMELLFTPSGALASASIETYLLETVRLISQAPGERNYHVFYEFLAGIPQANRQDLHIANATAEDFRMTACSGTFDRRDGVDDRETYQALIKALDTVGFSKREQTDMMSVACALLFTSNLDFQEAKTATGDDGTELVQSPSLRSALELLGVPLEALNNAMCLCAIEARGEVFYKNLSVDQSIKAVEALIKATYGALFTHIVETINKSIAAKNNSEKRPANMSRIGVLDIFGFESFDFNSFEQLCINYCNEALQQQFNRFVFKLEQQEYNREGIQWKFIEFPDNQDILDLIEKRRDGILSILDEQCRLATCTDSSFCRAVQDKCKDHPRFTATIVQRSEMTFSIHHYAGVVKYDSVNFLEKNKDELPKETTELLTSSSVNFLSYLGEMLSKRATETAAGNNQRSPTSASSFSKYGRKAGSPTNKKVGSPTNKKSSFYRESIGGQFSRQLRELRERIDSTTPHYVRCLKPNESLVPYQFEAHIIADQLRCAGVLEAIRVSRVGFPHRYFHESFVQRYGILNTSGIKSRGRAHPKEKCVALVKNLGPQLLDALKRQGHGSGALERQETVNLGMQMGHTKVFLRRPIYEALEYLRSLHVVKSAIVIQRNVRRFIAQVQYYDSYMAVITIQCFLRKEIASRALRQVKYFTAAAKIQNAYRRFMAETAFMAVRLIAHFCQAYRRGAIARRLYSIMRVEKQAMAIQKCWLRWQNRRLFIQMRRASIVVQCYWRRRRAKQALRELRLEARDLNVVAAERDRFKEESLRLRKEVELLRKSQTSGVNGQLHNEEMDSLRKEVETLRWTQNLDASTIHDGEIEYLKTEVERLQGVLSRQNNILNDGQNDKPPEAVIVRKGSWSLFGGRRDDASSIGNSYSPMPAFRRVLSGRAPKDVDRERYPSEGMHSRGDVAAFPWPASGPNQNLSSSSFSLLDGERNAPTSDAPSDDISKIYTTTTMPLPSPRFDPDPVPLEERRGFDFTAEMNWLHESIRDSDSRRVGDILRAAREPHVLANEGGESGRTALHLSVLVDNLKITRMLLEKGAIVNYQDNNGETPLHLAGGPLMTNFLLETGKANPNIPSIDGICALHLAVERKDPGSVRVLIKHHAKVDTADNLRWLTPIHVVSMPDREVPEDSQHAGRARATIAELLCSVDGANLNEQDQEGNTPLHYAVQIDTPDACKVVETLLEKGASPRIPNSRNQLPLLLLCHNDELRKDDGFQECLHAMLFHGADPNRQSNTGCTPLHLSLYHKDVDSAVQLVNRGAELHLLWKKPKRWMAFWDEMGTAEVLALDMVTDDHALHRILAAIATPLKMAPTRPWCMSCKTALGSFARALHCRHCSRHVCSACTRCTLPPDYFPKSFDLYEPSWVCTVCEKILIARKEENSSSTHPISSLGDEDDRYL